MSSTLPHEAALADLVERVRAADPADVQRLILFGSVARAAHDATSDLDLLVVVAETADRAAVEERIRDLAYDVMLDHGVAISIHGVSEATLAQREDHPFFARVRAEGRTISG